MGWSGWSETRAEPDAGRDEHSGRRRRRIKLGIAGVVAALVVAAGPSLAASAPEPTPPTGPELLEGIQPPAWALPPAPASDHEIAVSQDAYTDLSASEALDLAMEESSDILSADLVPELELEGGQEIDSFPAADMAVVDNPGSAPSALVQSFGTPLRAPEAGAQAPLDGDLVAEGDHYEVENAPVETELPAEAQDPIEIPGTGVGVDVDAAASAEAEVISDKVVIPNSHPDTTTVLLPAALGTDVVYLVNSAAAPELYSIDLDLPSGATLESSAGGAAEIVSAGEAILSVEAPTAFDAEGTEVPVHYEISGSRLDVFVNHRSGDFLYPLTVDPYFKDAYNWNAGESSTNMWSNAIQSPQNGNYLMPFFGPVVGGGISVIAQKNRTYPANSYGEWYSTPFPDTYIENVDFNNVDHNPDNTLTNPAACTYESILSGGGWISGTAVDRTAEPDISYPNYAYYPICGYTTNQNSSFYVGNSAIPDGAGGDAEAQPLDLPNSASHAIFMLASGAGTRVADAGNLMRAVNVWRYDDYKPTIVPIAGSPPDPTVAAHWVDDSDPTKTDKRATFQLADRGLGLLRLQVNRIDNGTRTILSNKDFGCQASHVNPCNLSYTYGTELLPEGVTRIEAKAFDAGEAPSAPVVWDAKVDRTAPTLQAPTGSLYTDRARLLTSVDYQLSVIATDGTTLAPRSGITKFELYVDGQPYPGLAPLTQTCSAGSCQMTGNWTVDPAQLSPGSHTIQPVATDALAHKNALSARDFQVTVVDDDVEPSITLTPGAPAANGSVPLTIDAVDAPGTSTDSGVEQLDLYVEGEVVKQLTKTCAANVGCGFHEQWTLSASQAPSVADITGVVYDRAGNSATQSIGRVGTYETFGYNDDWAALGQPMIEKAQAGGANVIRLFMNWCAIADDPALENQPNSWKWWAFGKSFSDPTAGGPMTDIYNINTDTDPNNDISVVLDLVDSPLWANNDHDAPLPGKPRDKDGACNGAAHAGDPLGPPVDGSAGPGYENPVAAPDSNHIDDWGQFVQGVVDRWGPAHDDPDLPGIQTLGDPEFGVVAIQVWNEPNSAKFWGARPALKNWAGPDQTRYAALVNETFSELQRVGLDSNPTLSLLAGSTSPTGSPVPGFLSAALPQIPAGTLDGIALHLYADNKKQDKGAAIRIKEEYQEVRQAVDATSHGGTPLWITEIGFPSYGPIEDSTSPGTFLVPNGIKNSDQRRRLVEAYRTYAAKARVRAFMVHRLVDAASGEPQQYGVLEEDKTPKSVYCKLAAFRGKVPSGCPVS